MLLNRGQYQQHIESIRNLFERSFGKTIPKDYLLWRYYNNPLDELFVAVEFDGDSIISHYAVSPALVFMDGVWKKAAMSMTTMTDPDYAGKGLFPKLADEIYESLKEKNYAFVFGFPNTQSHRGFIQKLDWIDIYEIPTFRLEIDNNTILQNNIPTDKLSTDNSFNLDYSTSQIIKQKNYILKNNDYLRWRYRDNPVNDYKCLVITSTGKVTSFCVMKNYENAIDIVDFQAFDMEEGYRLLQEVLTIAKSDNITAINIWAPRHCFIHQLCEKIGFVNKEPVTYFCCRTFDPSIGNCSIYSNWYIQMGDSDVY